jgi:hypothetical protein
VNIVYHERVDPSLLPDNATAATYTSCIEIVNVTTHAATLINSINDTSWISQLSPVARLSYEQTALRTIGKLVRIFQSVQGKVTEEFGEFMISMSAGECLKQELDHDVVPLSELWKEKVSNNHGFDFHTESPQEKVAFGEAKYNSTSNPYTTAATQIIRFIDEGKDGGDAVHLAHLVSLNANANLIAGNRGFIVAFSLHSPNHERILDNAISSDAIQELSTQCDELYIIGVRA